ncbi:Delta-1-pyrroline-5-carboxylate synthetase, partial [Globisporangium splendens]
MLLNKLSKSVAPRCAQAFQARGAGMSTKAVVDNFASPDHYFEKDRISAGDPSKRAFTYFLLGGARVAYATAGRLAVIKFVGSMSASADVLALATAEFDLSNIDEGATVTVKWRGKPIFIKHRTDKEITISKDVNVANLKDPETDDVRVQNPKWLIVLGVCTHLGCVPTSNAGEYGGWFCPCHGSHYDLSGRIRKGPAPLNLEIPPYKFIEENKVLLDRMASCAQEAVDDDVRRELKRARTILVKIGTEIVHSTDGVLAMGQIGAIVEQIAMLHMQGHNIILVSSGSVAIGKMVLHRQYLLSGSMQSHLGGRVGESVNFFEKACAAAGQSGLQSLYEMLFAQYHLACSQLLASDADFRIPTVRQNLKKTVRTLLDVGIIPVINENDVITLRKTPLIQDKKIAWDNDSLASLFAQELGVDLMIILTDIDGVYTANAGNNTCISAFKFVVHGVQCVDIISSSVDGSGKTLIHEFKPSDTGIISPQSRVGPVGQKDKLHSCIRAVDSGAVRAAVIAKAEPGSLLRLLKGERVGTLFAVRDGIRIGAESDNEDHIDPLYSGISNPKSKL